VSVCVSARACAREGAVRGMGVQVIFILVVASCDGVKLVGHWGQPSCKSEQDDESARKSYFCRCELGCSESCWALGVTFVQGYTK